MDCTNCLKRKAVAKLIRVDDEGEEIETEEKPAIWCYVCIGEQVKLTEQNQQH